MSMRFKILAAMYLLLVIGAASNQDLGGIDSVFTALASLLIFAVLALWPTAAPTDRVDRAMSGTNWSDRIDFDHLPRE